ncbi:actin-binding FH2 [Tanacetum coccineum]
MKTSKKELPVLKPPLEQESMFRRQEGMLRRQEQQQARTRYSGANLSLLLFYILKELAHAKSDTLSRYNPEQGQAHFEAIVEKKHNIPEKANITLSLPSEEASPVVKDFCLDNGKINMEVKNKGFDMKVAWDDPENKQIDLEDFNLEKEISKIKNHFHLNSCLTEDDDLIVRKSYKSLSEKMKTITMDIDLEVPALPEAEEEEIIKEVKKIADFDFKSKEKIAAEAMVAMNGIFNQQDQVGSTSEMVAGLPEEFQKGDMVDALPREEHKSGIRREV